MPQQQERLTDPGGAERRLYPLNLSPKYAPSWTVWEAAREIVCNAIDADDDYQLDSPNDNTLTVTTSTVPSIAELMMIGEGSKCIGGPTIGQFGEGFKLAALTATRAGGSLEVTLPDARVTFSIETLPGMEAKSLVAWIERCDTGHQGCRIELRMKGAGYITKGRILEDRTDGPVPKLDGSKLRIYCKGVFIREFSGHSLMDWNLNDLTINRDRDMVHEWAVRYAVASWIDHNPTLDQDLVTQNTFETSAKDGDGMLILDQTKRRLVAAFHAVHGQNAVLECDNAATNDRAKKAGYTVIAPVNNLVKRIGVPTAADVVSKYAPEPVDIAPFADRIAWLRRLDPIFGAVEVTVCVFKAESMNLMGLASFSDNRIWLSERLFDAGRERDLVATYLHEHAHFTSGADDLTPDFEYGLSMLAGQLALSILEASK